MLKSKFFLVAILVASSFVASQPSSLAAATSICNSASCDNPQNQSVYGQPQNSTLNRPAPINVCEVINNWKVDAVIQVVAGLLKVNLFYTLVPSVVCHLVG
jgi:hypothetical protein